jgi:hypothetical protein
MTKKVYERVVYEFTLPSGAVLAVDKEAGAWIEEIARDAERYRAAIELGVLDSDELNEALGVVSDVIVSAMGKEKP